MAQLLSICFLFAFIGYSLAEQTLFFVLADKGESCREACWTRQSNCDMTDLTKVAEDEIMSAFKRMDVKCTFDDRVWWEFNQPSVVVDPFDENFGRCLGWRGKPEFHDCAARWPTVRRLCQCAKDIQCSKRVQL